MKDKKFFALSSVFFLLFLAVMGITTLNQPINRFLRAKNTTPSPLKSFVIIFPQTAKTSNENSADKSTKIKLSVYIRDVNSVVLPNRNVKVTSSLSGVIFTPSDTQNTNELGMAQFYMTSSVPGTAYLTAVDVETNTSIANIPTVEFTK